MARKNGSFQQQQAAFGQYLVRWFATINADTLALDEYKARPVAEAIKWAPSRMIDAAEDMLEQYRKNENGEAGASTKLPVILVASDDDFVGTGADWGGHHIERRLLQIEENGSWYGHRELMHDRRFQIVIAASEGDTAKSLAAQLSWYMKQLSNRYMDAIYQFGQYQVPAPIQLEGNRIDWMLVKTDGVKNLKMLAADITIKCTVPMFDAPAEGEANDGTTNNPPGYPLVKVVDSQQSMSLDNEQWKQGREYLSE